MLKVFRGAVLHILGILIACVLALSVAGCGAIERMGQWIDENPVVAQMAVTQAVVRFIAAGETSQKIESRKAATVDVLNKTLSFLEGNPRARVDTIFNVLNAHIDWDSLSPPDRLLLLEVIRFVQSDLERKQDNNQLSHDTVLAIRALLNTAVRAAEQY